jgi:RNA polymerase primary sigma factor
LYLAELAHTAPITAEEEARLSKCIQARERALFAEIVAAGARVDELLRLADRLAAGDAAVPDVLDPHAPAANPPTAEELATELRRLGQGRARGNGAERALGRAHIQAIGERVTRELRPVAEAEAQMAAARTAVGGLAEKELARHVRKGTSPHGVSAPALQQANRAIHEARATIRQAEQSLGCRRATLRRVARSVGEAERALLATKAELTRANLRLVVMFARKYVGRGVSIGDLIQEGNLGLMRAAEKYDHRVGTRFSTYAAWWVRQAMQRAVIAQGSDIRIPVHVNTLRMRAAAAGRRLAARRGREPELQEIAQALGVGVHKVIDSDQASRVSTVSLDNRVPTEAGEGRTLGEVLSDASAELADEAVERGDREDQARRLLARLSDREQSILRMRFGIGGCRVRTLREIGEHMNVSRERIRQIEAQALGKLRAAMTT